MFPGRICGVSDGVLTGEKPDSACCAKGAVTDN